MSTTMLARIAACTLGGLLALSPLAAWSTTPPEVALYQQRLAQRKSATSDVEISFTETTMAFNMSRGGAPLRAGEITGLTRMHSDGSYDVTHQRHYRLLFRGNKYRFESTQEMERGDGNITATRVSVCDGLAVKTLSTYVPPPGRRMQPRFRVVHLTAGDQAKMATGDLGHGNAGIRRNLFPQLPPEDDIAKLREEANLATSPDEVAVVAETTDGRSRKVFRFERGTGRLKEYIGSTTDGVVLTRAYEYQGDSETPSRVRKTQGFGTTEDFNPTVIEELEIHEWRELTDKDAADDTLFDLPRPTEPHEYEEEGTPEPAAAAP